MSDSELMNLFNMMKSDFFAQDMSPMIRSTADKYDTYLTEKSDSLTPEQKENYEKQRDVGYFFSFFFHQIFLATTCDC